MGVKVFVSASTFAKNGREPLNLLKESGLPYFINPLGRRLTHDEIIRFSDSCEGVIAGLEPYDEYVIDNLPELRCISRCGTGLDNISLEKAEQRGIVVFNTPEAVIQPVAELAIAMLFDLLRNVSFCTILLKSGKWQRRASSLLSGVTVGILGLGKIGRRTAELLNRLEANIYGADIAPDKEWAENNNVKIVSVQELLATVDILSIHLSASPDNPFQLNEEKIAAMKKGAAVINTSRGRFIDETALYKALKSGYLSAAALDVFSKEPYEGNLRELDNVILTPHAATLTKESRLQMEVEAAKNLIGFLNDEK